jgi:hypothetical protein
MHIERFFVPGLAHASYLVASEEDAVVIDPERNVDGYLAQNKLQTGSSRWLQTCPTGRPTDR